MEKATISKLNKSFEESAYEQDGIEYWLARELQVLLEYTQWRNFLNVIEKAKESCRKLLNSQIKTSMPLMGKAYILLNSILRIG